MVDRALIRRHPHMTAMVTFVLAFFIWGWLMPWAWHQPLDWRGTISASVEIVLTGYFIRYVAGIRSGRVQALVLATASLGALAVYATAVHAHGIPRDTTERLYFAGVVAIPIAGIMLAFWMLRKSRVAA